MNKLLIALLTGSFFRFNMAADGGGSVDMDTLLDSTLDDLADLPEFKNFPVGAHKVSISFESKEVNKHPAIELKMKAIETVELANPQEDKPLEAGTEGTVLYMLDNEFGQGKLKEIMKPLSQSLGTSKIKETIEKAKDLECVVVVKLRKNKEKTAEFMDIVSLTIC